MVDGEEYWFSRSVAVVCFVFTEDENNKVYILANKRGKGCPDFVGKWNAPCGFLDFNETAAEGAVREVYEECGIHINPADLIELKADSDPRSGSGNQSINIRFCCFIKNGLKLELSADHSEKDEVEEIKWIPVSDIGNYDWAFTHKRRIEEMLDAYKRETFLNKLRECIDNKSVGVVVNDGKNYKLYKTTDEKYLSEITDLIKLAIVDCKLYNYDGHKIFDSDNPIVRMGSYEFLCKTFGGKFNDKGYFELDSHIGLIYGDAINMKRQAEIYRQLEDKGIAATNLVLGIGSFTYQCSTRDGLGLAMKATYCEIDGKPKEIFKDPKTTISSGMTKKSLRGLISVGLNSDGDFVVHDRVTPEAENNGCLLTVFENGEIVEDSFVDLYTIRETRSRLAAKAVMQDLATM